MEQNFEHRRNNDDSAQRLDTATVKWLSNLAEKQRPNMLAGQFPRIANRLALLWPDATATQAYLDELMFDKRGNRQGFPIAISLELATLKELVVDQRDAASAAQRSGSLSALKRL